MASFGWGLLLVAGLATIISVDAWSPENVTGTVITSDPLGILLYNDSCNSGSCRFGGIKSFWKIPLQPGEYGYLVASVTQAPSTIPKSITAAAFVKASSSIEVVQSTGGAAGCCYLCKYYFQCNYWQFIKVGCGKCKQGLCFIYKGDVTPTYVGPSGGVNVTAAGSKCQLPDCNDDPHLTGAHGTKYDFSGFPGKAFALLSDRRLQINMAMAGYLDERTESGTTFLEGKAVRTWIRELGIVWTGEEGEEHKLRLVARAGRETARGEGYLERAELDGADVPKMAVGEEAELAGGLTIALEAHEKKGDFDVDFYSVKIDGLLDMEMRLRQAQPLLQTPEEAYVHISVAFRNIKHTPAIHGVLGQTFRESHRVRAANFAEILTKSLTPISADGESGKGFLDGEKDDYVVRDVLDTEFLFSAYRPKSKVDTM